MRSKTILLTAFALIAFASNSILCRLALGAREIDAASFTTIRLVSGAIALALLVALTRAKNSSAKRSAQITWSSATALFVYAVGFSFAYLGLTAGTGALILFACVQATMIAAPIVSGHSPRPMQWLGLAIALGGLTYLLMPGLAAPPLINALLMASAGIAWGVYSLLGRGTGDPIGATAANFAWSVPLTLIVSLAFIPAFHSSPKGTLLAATSGAITSGMGYVLWYAALPTLGATRAAIVQLLVPIVAAFGGVTLLGEVFTGRLALSSAITLIGVALAMFAPGIKTKRNEAPT